MSYELEMIALSTPHVRMQTLRCDGCGEIIGVYEPLVVVSGNEVRTTSRAAEPDLPVDLGEHFHRGCHSAHPHERSSA